MNGIDFDNLFSDLNLNVKYKYGTNPDYDVIAFLEDIDLDREKMEDLKKSKGFIISSKGKIKKDIKNPDGVFSTKFGQRLGDENPYIDRYSCQCGKLMSAINEGIVCERCGSVCKKVGDDFSIFGWIEINKEYAVIHPSIYKQLDSFFGRSKYIKDRRSKVGSILQNMLDFDREMDQNANIVGYKEKAGEPYYGIGMVEFHEKYDEILEFYYKKNKKKELYEYLVHVKDITFTNSIPVFTTLLRPMDINAGTMYFEKTNAYYNMMAVLANSINKNQRRMDRAPKMKNQQLYRFQMKMMMLYNEIVEILNGKKGYMRNLVAGRFNFSSRSVIRQNPSLRIDQIELPYVELVITLEQQIINILHKTLNISYQEAYDKWDASIAEVDDVIVKIINDIIHNTCGGEGIPVIINRNPSINFGSLMQCFCVGINFDYTMSTPLQILIPLAADYDGDQLNCFHIINEAFFLRAYEVFNPRNNMYLSKNDGLLNREVLPQKDTIVGATTLNDLTYGKYSEAQLEHIRRIKERAAAVA